jgi:uncharacterized protein (TIGR03435 family)
MHFLALMVALTDPDPCGLATIPRAGATGHVAAKGMELTSLIGVISRDAGRAVVDRTGLTGAFDFELTWTPQAFQRGTSTDPVFQASIRMDRHCSPPLKNNSA